MSCRWLAGVFSLAAMLVGVGPALAQTAQPSLAEIARQEAERRKGVGQPAKVYRNDDTKAGRPLTTGSATLAKDLAASQRPPDAQKAGEPAAGTAESTTAAAAAGGAATSKGDDAREALLKRILDVKEQISKNELGKERITSQLDQMNNDIIDAFDSQVRQRLVEERDAALASYRRLDAEVEGLRKVLADLEADARSTAPPSN
jgi:hypothetical protein